MIPNPDTLARIREQADAFARQRIESFPGGEMRDIDKLLGIIFGWHLRARSERHRRPRLILPGDRVWRFR